ncbi:hypothetical protein L596_024861 [Steinernema carpocapsae]|uniref:Uncharacterized protein n=1 Tax=Steinernema carpocapsae TaxID=34508 RepID=A0A4U5M611_STECR|nr:hypothetical protein L596_024861 [Steinernema carpocapsae]
MNGISSGSIVLWSLFLAPLLITVLICMLYLEAIKKPSMAKPLMKWGHYGVTGATVFVDILTGYKAVTDYAEYRMEDMIFKAAVSVLAVVKTGGALAYYVSRMLANIRRNVRI